MTMGVGSEVLDLLARGFEFECPAPMQMLSLLSCDYNPSVGELILITSQFSYFSSFRFNEGPCLKKSGGEQKRTLTLLLWVLHAQGCAPLPLSHSCAYKIVVADNNNNNRLGNIVQQQNSCLVCMKTQAQLPVFKTKSLVKNERKY